MSILSTVDKLGHLLAQAADLEGRIKAEKAKLIAAGVGEHEGDIFRATVSHSVREKLDADAIARAIELAKFSPQYVSAHTLRSEVNCVRVVAKLAVAA
jgi:hypothetical protein